LRAEVSVGWWLPDDEDTSDLEDMEWNAVLRLLRRTGKRNYNMFGEERSEEEHAEIDRELAQAFYM
jgi:hypothetical protein